MRLGPLMQYQPGLGAMGAFLSRPDHDLRMRLGLREPAKPADYRFNRPPASLSRVRRLHALVGLQPLATVSAWLPEA